MAGTSIAAPREPLETETVVSKQPTAYLGSGAAAAAREELVLAGNSYYKSEMELPQVAALFREQPFDVFARMFRAVELVQERLNRACLALGEAQVSYAVVGGNAVVAWVATVDDRAVRSTHDVDLWLAKEELPRATAALRAAGFYRTEVLDPMVFLDGPDGTPSQGLHILLAGRKVKAEHLSPTPQVYQSVELNQKQVLDLQALVEMKLNSFRRTDKVLLQDLIQTGLVDDTWLSVSCRAGHPTAKPA